MNGVAVSSGPKPARVWHVFLAVMVLGMAVIAADPGGLSSLVRGAQFDLYAQIHPRPYANTPVRAGYRIRTLDFADAPPAWRSWPLECDGLAQLIGALHDAGAAIVVIAAPLTAPDPLSPELLARSLPPTAPPSLRQQLSQLPPPEAGLAAALATVRAVTAVRLTEREGAAFYPHTKLMLDGPVRALAPVADFAGAALPLPRLAAASAALGADNLAADRDGIIRAVPMVLRQGGRPVPSLSASVLHLVRGAPLTAVANEPLLPWLPGGAQLIRLSSGAFSLPLRADGAMTIWFSGPEPARAISVAALAGGRFGTTGLAHSIVIVADPAASVATPLGRESLAQFEAEALENMLAASAWRQADGVAAQLVFLCGVGLIVLVLLAWAGLVWSGAVTLAALVAANGFAWAVFHFDHVLFDVANASVWLVLAFVAAVIAWWMQISANRRALRQMFAGAAPEPMVDHLARAPARFKRQGEARIVTCLSVEVRDYAGLNAAFAGDPVGLNRLLGLLMPVLAEAALAHGGFIDGLTAGGFKAYWNAPLDDGAHALHACAAGRRMIAALAEVKAQRLGAGNGAGRPELALELDVGVATGPAVAGVLALAGRPLYAVAGQCSALAERIGGLCGGYGAAIVVAETTRAAAERSYAFLEVDFAVLDPTGAPVRLFALLGDPAVRSSPKFRALATFHDRMFQALRTQQWDKARDLIAQCRQLSGASQALYDLHLARIAFFEHAPPGSGWDGAFRQIVR